MNKSILRLLVVGLTGSGKTHWVDNAIVKRQSRCAVWDPYGNYSVGYFDKVEKVPPNAQRWGIRVNWNSKKDFREQFLAFVERAQKERTPLIVIDEILLICLLGCEEALLVCVTQAQNFGCRVVVVGQTAYMVPVIVRSQSSHVVSFQQHDEHDCHALRKMCADTDGKIFGTERLRALKRGEHVSALVRST